MILGQAMVLAPLYFDIMELELSPARKPVKPKAKADEANSETPEKAINLGFEVDPKKVYIFETIKKSEQPRNENLGSTCKGFDPVEKRYREMRYFPTAESIFADEQHESYDELQPPPLGFYRNQLTASGEDIRLMEYLMNHPLFENSPFRVANKPAFFTLADKEVQEEIKAKRHAKELSALEVIKDTAVDDLKPIARNIFGITEQSDTAIINALNELVKNPKQGSEAMSNAEKLLDNTSNPQLLRTYHIQAAIDRGIIAADLNKMRATLVDGNVFICNLNTKSPVKELVDWSYTGEGGKWYTTLRTKI